MTTTQGGSGSSGARSRTWNSCSKGRRDAIPLPRIGGDLTSRGRLARESRSCRDTSTDLRDITDRTGHLRDDLIDWRAVRALRRTGHPVRVCASVATVGASCCAAWSTTSELCRHADTVADPAGRERCSTGRPCGRPGDFACCARLARRLRVRSGTWLGVATSPRRRLGGMSRHRSSSPEPTWPRRSDVCDPGRRVPSPATSGVREGSRPVPAIVRSRHGLTH